jgi:phage tail-like protein
MTVRTNTYLEGGNHLVPKEIIDSVELKPVTLIRGVTADLSFHGWAKQFIEVHRGRIDQADRPSAQVPVLPGDFGGEVPVQQDIYAPLSFRKDVIISHLNREGKPVKTYTLFNAIPVEYEPASTFTSDGDDMLSMEKLTLKYESFSVTSNNIDNNPFDVRDVAKRLIRRT